MNCPCPPGWRAAGPSGILPPMSPPAAALLEPAPVSVADDPVWAAMLASPIAEDDLTDDERAGLEEGMADIRAGRVVPHDVVLATIERMHAEQGE